MITHAPKTEEEAAKIIQEATAAGTRLRIQGGGTRSSIGQNITTDEVLSTKNLSGISLYEPGEMVLAAKAGTPVAEIQKALADNKQMLTFEPMDHSALLGTKGSPTIGAVVAGNISGPRRIYGGAARDSLIGVRFVNGKGEIIKNGGRVMKNVTGLDLVKLQAGAWGTLGLLTEVIFKLLPAPDRVATLMFKGLDDETAIQALCAAAGTPFEPTGLAHLPACIGDKGPRTLIRVEGFDEQVSYRLAELQKALANYGEASVVEGKTQGDLWASVRDVTFLTEPKNKAIWKLSVRPTSAPNTIAVIEQAIDCTYYFDWSGGLVWLAIDEEDDAGVETVRNAANAAEGYATLIRGSEELRSRIDVFEPQIEPLKVVSHGIKKSFDPAGVLNTGLMVAEG
ncbi:MAG: FAD-binding protein [Hyphomicrobiales bacterium]